MKIYSGTQIYEADRLTIEKQDINAQELMERAAISCFNWLHKRLQHSPLKIHVFCGMGNNGGDGLAITRHLIQHGYHAKAYVLKYGKSRSTEFLANYEALKDMKEWPLMLEENSELPEIKPNDLIVDAVFGIGLNRPLDNWIKNIFGYLNQSGASILSVDIPSGLYMNKRPEDLNGVIRAMHTLCFQSVKLPLILPETSYFSESWEIIDIGLDSEYLETTEVDNYFIIKQDVLGLYQPRPKTAHKGMFGHALIVGGTYGKIGAVQLAAKAALKSGCGLISAYVPKCGYIPLQTSFPEAMVFTDNGEKQIEEFHWNIEPTSIAIGMGMGTSENTIKGFTKFLKNNHLPLVMDADALNCIATNPELKKLIAPDSILTPHLGELKRWIGEWEDDFDKLEKVKQLSNEIKSIIIVKGYNTAIIYQGKTYFNSTGNVGLATAGSGDVLSGIIAGLLSQGYPSLNAAIFGVYLHGLSANIGITDTGFQSFIASDIISNLGKSYKNLLEPEQVPQPPTNSKHRNNEENDEEYYA